MRFTKCEHEYVVTFRWKFIKVGENPTKFINANVLTTFQGNVPQCWHQCLKMFKITLNLDQSKGVQIRYISTKILLQKSTMYLHVFAKIGFDTAVNEPSKIVVSWLLIPRCWNVNITCRVPFFQTCKVLPTTVTETHVHWQEWCWWKQCVQTSISFA